MRNQDMHACARRDPNSIACAQEGNYSVSCACKCKSITCDFESHSEVTLDTNHTTGKCSCSH